jgi:sugar lactone lactonase YvrE
MRVAPILLTLVLGALVLWLLFDQESVTIAPPEGTSGVAPSPLNAPMGLLQGDDGSVLVVDVADHVIRRIEADGNVTAWVGAPGEPGNIDAEGRKARFREPVALARGADGHVYVADRGNNAIRGIDRHGRVWTLPLQIQAPMSIAILPSGDLLVGGISGLFRVTPQGTAAPYGMKELRNVRAVAVDDLGRVYAAEFSGDRRAFAGRIYRFRPDGSVWPWPDSEEEALTLPSPMALALIDSDTLIVASSGVYAPAAGFGAVHNALLRVDAFGRSQVIAPYAGFRMPQGLAVGRTRELLVADTLNRAVRRVNLQTFGIATLAGPVPVSVRAVPSVNGVLRGSDALDRT